MSGANGPSKVKFYFLKIINRVKKMHILMLIQVCKKYFTVV
jgi:hypothetical protein